jgi:putative ABC transport system substrate-binding protein
MERRAFIILFAAATAASLLRARAEQSGKVYRIGLLTAGARSEVPWLQSGIHDGLTDLGWVEGKNLIFESRYADNSLVRLPALAAELVSLGVDVIVTIGTLAPIAAKRATLTIPIVMTSTGDPVGSGLVASLARPGGNVTGLSLMAPELAGKRLELLKEILPGISRVAILWNAANPYSALVFKETASAARALGLELQSLEIRAPADLDGALDAAKAQHADTLITVEDPLTMDHAAKIANFSVDNRLPAISGLKVFTNAGGFVSYGADLNELFRRSASYIDKILKGEKPADIPVEQPTKFELVVNLKTAKALGLTVPPSILARTDEVIE